MLIFCQVITSVPIQVSVYLDVDELLAVKQLKSGVVNDWQDVDETQSSREIPRVDEVAAETQMNVELERRVGPSSH